MEKWRHSFTATIILNNDVGQRAKIPTPFDISIDQHILHFESFSGTTFSGYLEFEIDDIIDDTNTIKHISNQIQNEKIQLFQEIMDLDNMKIEFIWGSLDGIDTPPGKTYKTSTSFTVGVSIAKTQDFDPSIFTNIENRYRNVNRHPNNRFLGNILKLSNIQANNVTEDFFNKWISFNLIFRWNSTNSSEINDLKNFVNNEFQIGDITTLINDHTTLIDILKNENLTNRTGTENYSIQLQNALNSNSDQEIWLNTVLCVYTIRNQLFHEGKQHSRLSLVNKFLKDVLRVSILNQI